jgi:hypothetical protein
MRTYATKEVPRTVLIEMVCDVCGATIEGGGTWWPGPTTGNDYVIDHHYEVKIEYCEFFAHQWDDPESAAFKTDLCPRCFEEVVVKAINNARAERGDPPIPFVRLDL